MKPRILITISYSFSIRFIVRTGLLEQIASFATPVIVLTWQQQDLIDELQQKGYEVHVYEEPKRTQDYIDVRRKIDIWFDHFSLPFPAKKNQQEYLDQFVPFQQKFIRKLRKAYNVFRMQSSSYVTDIFKKEKELIESSDAFRTAKEKISSMNIDAVFTVTPFHRQEDILLRAAAALQKKMITAILSFDNITKRGWIPVHYHTYMVWNKENKEQLLSIYNYVKPQQVFVTGAPQFDFYFNANNLLPKKAWQKLTGVEEYAHKKIILYAGGPRALFPTEPSYLLTIDAAIENGTIQGSPVVLFRCHPIDDINRWKHALQHTKHIVFDHSWTGEKHAGNTNITSTDIQKLCSTLAYTDVHVNLCSTMTVDGSAFNKPQIGPAYLSTHNATKLLQKLYYQEHFGPVMKTGGLQLAASANELVTYINDALQHPEKYTKGNADILRSVITYTDGACTQRVAEVLKHCVPG